MTFRDTHFTVTLLSEDIKSYYTTRVLELQNISVGPIPGEGMIHTSLGRVECFYSPVFIEINLLMKCPFFLSCHLQYQCGEF